MVRPRRVKGRALKQRDPYRQPKRNMRLRATGGRAHQGSPDQDDKGSLFGELKGCIVWIPVIVTISIILYSMMKHLILLITLILPTIVALAQTPDTLPPLSVQPDPIIQGIQHSPNGTPWVTMKGTFYDRSRSLQDTVYLLNYVNGVPTIYELSRINKSPERMLLVFKNPRRGQITTELLALGLVATGGMLGGKAEYYSRYHGTTSNFDAFHLTRDAGLLVTGLGAASLGASFALDEKLSPWEVGCKLVLAALLYRTSAEAVYEWMN